MGDVIGDALARAGARKLEHHGEAVKCEFAAKAEPVQLALDAA